MKKISCWVVVLFLAILFASIALAGDKSKKSGKIKAWQEWVMIEPNYHHLGDDIIEDFIIPEPEGTVWESSFFCSKSILKRADTALVKFFANNIDWADLIVNGERIGVDFTSGANFELFVLRVPLELLQSGKNTISFAVNQWNDGTWDDIQFGDLQIGFQ